MGITIRCCRKGGAEMDLGYGGFARLRSRVASLIGPEVKEHYDGLVAAPLFLPMRNAYFKEYDERTEEMVGNGVLPGDLADFLYQSDVEGDIDYKTCRHLLEIIGDYDDDFIYGYAGRENPAMFKDFKAILQECSKTRRRMKWS